MRIVRVVGEAILLLLGIVQDEPELHAFAGQLAIGQAADPGENCRKPAFGPFGRKLRRALCRLAPNRAVISVKSSTSRSVATFRYAARRSQLPCVQAFEIVVARRTFARAGPRAVQVLAPQQKFDRVIAGGDIGLDALRLPEAAAAGSYR